jgi:hypothetical protein
MYEGIRELTAGELPKFGKAAAFAAHCFGLRNAEGLVPVERFAPQNIPSLAPQITIIGVIDGIVPEPLGGAHADPELAALLLKDQQRPLGELVAKRDARTVRQV